jgi:regulator of replication initiation timing
MIVYMATKKDVKKEISKVEQMLNQLCDDNSLLKSENDALIEKVKVLEERWNRFQNTDAILKKVMEEKNKWWFLDSIEESLYRNVIEIIQNI